MHMLANSISDPSSEDVIKMLAIGGSMLIGALAVVFGIVSKMVVGTNRERSRREISAYVAEGSMTAEEGERLLNAGSAACRTAR